MSIVETVLVFVGIPAGLFALLAALVLAPTANRAPRYRPSTGWSYQPVWYLPHPAHSEPISAMQAGSALEASNRLAVTGSAALAHPVHASGGASGEW